MSPARQPARARAHPAARRPRRRRAGGGRRPGEGRRRPPRLECGVGDAGRGGARRRRAGHGVRLRPHRLPPRAGPAAPGRLEGLRGRCPGRTSPTAVSCGRWPRCTGRPRRSVSWTRRSGPRRSWPSPTRPPSPRSGSGSHAGAAPAGQGPARAPHGRRPTVRAPAGSSSHGPAAARRSAAAAADVRAADRAVRGGGRRGVARGARPRRPRATVLRPDRRGDQPRGVAREPARRAVELVVGVSLGVLVGDLLISVIGSGWWQITLVVILAVAAAVFFDGGSLLVNQAGASAVLVATLLPPGQAGGLDRCVDALIGGLVGVLVVAAVLPSDPVGPVRRTSRALLDELAAVLRGVADALRDRDADAALAALQRARRTQPLIDSLRGALHGGREVTAVSPLHRRRRRVLARYAELAERADYAMRNARVVARRAYSALLDGEPEVPDLPDVLAELACAVDRLTAELTREGDLARARSAVVDVVAHAKVMSDDARRAARAPPSRCSSRRSARSRWTCCRRPGSRAPRRAPRCTPRRPARSARKRSPGSLAGPGGDSLQSSSSPIATPVSTTPPPCDASHLEDRFSPTTFTATAPAKFTRTFGKRNTIPAAHGRGCCAAGRRRRRQARPRGVQRDRPVRRAPRGRRDARRRTRARRQDRARPPRRQRPATRWHPRWRTRSATRSACARRSCR